MEVDDEHYSIEAVQHGATQSGPETGVTWYQPSTAPGHVLCVDTENTVPIIENPDYHQLAPNGNAPVRHPATILPKTWMQLFVKEQDGAASQSVGNVTLPRDISPTQIMRLTLVKHILGIPNDDIPRRIQAYLDTNEVSADHCFPYACNINMIYTRQPVDRPIIMSIARRE